MAADKGFSLPTAQQVMEKLALAADGHDLCSLVSMASELRAIAQENGIVPIAEAATKLEQSAADNSNQVHIIELTIDLLEMCRQTQRALLPSVASPSKPKRNRAKENGVGSQQGA